METIQSDIPEQECDKTSFTSYSYKVGFNAALVSVFADSLCIDDEMRIDTIIQSLAAEFSRQYSVLQNPLEVIDEFLSSV